MPATNPGQRNMQDFKERVNKIIDEVLELSLLYDCQSYFLVDYREGVEIFNSVEDGSWPPPDGTIVTSNNRPVTRTYSFQEVLKRVNEDERKELIQILLYNAELVRGRREDSDEGTKAPNASDPGSPWKSYLSYKEEMEGTEEKINDHKSPAVEMQFSRKNDRVKNSAEGGDMREEKSKNGEEGGNKDDLEHHLGSGKKRKKDDRDAEIIDEVIRRVTGPWEDWVVPQ